MSRLGDFDTLAGTEFRLDHPYLRSKTFILDEKLTEEYQTASQLECDQGLGPSFAVLKFSCHNSLNPSQQGFIRIYRQIPIDGTILHPLEERARQATSPRSHAEIDALKQLYDQNCTAVPRLLGLGTELQGAGDYVPGGYITYVAWERVSGEPIKFRDFWERDLEYRKQVRSAFDTAYYELKRCGWRPILLHPEKLIYDESKKVIHIAGFRGAVPFESDQSMDVAYACWGLAKPCGGLDWHAHSSDWTW